MKRLDRSRSVGVAGDRLLHEVHDVVGKRRVEEWESRTEVIAARGRGRSWVRAEETSCPTSSPSSPAKPTVTAPGTTCTDDGPRHPRLHPRPTAHPQWHRAPPSPALTPRSSPPPLPPAPRATHGRDSALPPSPLDRRRTYASAVSNGGTLAPLHASTASEAPSPVSASLLSHSPGTSSRSNYSSRTRVDTTMMPEVRTEEMAYHIRRQHSAPGVLVD